MREPASGVVTFLFTDIEGSTRLLQTLGNEYPDAVHEHRRLLCEAVEREGGVTYGVLGDEVSAVFRTTAEAVAAASSGQRSFATTNWPGRVNVRVRMGIHAGRPVGDTGEYLGLDVHRTARICSAGHGGQVLISEAAHNSLGNASLTGLTFRDLGKHALKDLPEPERLFQLLIAGVRNDFPPLRVGDQRPPQPSRRTGELVGSLQRALKALHRRSYVRSLETDRIAPSEILSTSQRRADDLPWE